VVRRRRLPKAEDFFGKAEPEAGEEPLAKTIEERPDAEDRQTTEEAIAEGRRLVREIEELGDQDDEQAAAMVEAAKKAEKAVERLYAAKEAARYKPRVVPPGVTEKVTFYLPPEQIRRLEVVKLELLLQHNLKVSRSQIIEAIVEGMEEQMAKIVEYLEERAE